MELHSKMIHYMLHDISLNIFLYRIELNFFIYDEFYRDTLTIVFRYKYIKRSSRRITTFISTYAFLEKMYTKNKRLCKPIEGILKSFFTIY